MAIGPTIRRALDANPAVVSWLTETYRGFFVDLDAVVDLVPAGAAATLLNVGTGDGELVNRLARRYPDLRVTSTDISDEQGWLVADDVRARVELVTRTPEQIAAAGFGGTYDVVLLSDVIHHVPVADRRTVLSAAWAAVAPGGRLVVKDIETRGVKATLSLWSDKYITGDKHTTLIGVREMADVLSEVSGQSTVVDSGLLPRNPPNYMQIVQRPAAA